MGKRTISDLGRELKVSRPRIYRAIDRLGLPRKAGAEYSIDEWELLKKELHMPLQIEAKKNSDGTKNKLGKKSPSDESGIQNLAADVDRSTLRERLKIAKQEFDYNRSLIVVFQKEIEAYAQENGKTTKPSSTGSETSISAIVNLEKYIKLNIALSKLISDIESTLKLKKDGGRNPFM